MPWDLSVVRSLLTSEYLVRIYDNATRLELTVNVTPKHCARGLMVRDEMQKCLPFTVVGGHLNDVGRVATKICARHAGSQACERIYQLAIVHCTACFTPKHI